MIYFAYLIAFLTFCFVLSNQCNLLGFLLHSLLLKNKTISKFIKCDTIFAKQYKSDIVLTMHLKMAYNNIVLLLFLPCTNNLIFHWCDTQNKIASNYKNFACFEILSGYNNFSFNLLKGYEIESWITHFESCSFASTVTYRYILWDLELF